MSPAACAHLAEQRSAYVDGSLAPAARDRMVSHLAHCAGCRDDVAGLRSVRDLLQRDGPTSPPLAPAALSSRLVSIAGEESRQPLWTRPFRRTRAGDLPSRRRTRRRRIGAAAAVGGAALGVAGLAGYLIAPPWGLAEISDPSPDAQSAFSASLRERPLATDVSGAVVLVDPDQLAAHGSVDDAPGVTAAHGHPLDAAAARTELNRAAVAAAAVSYRGRQLFVAHRAGTTLTATARVVRTSQGTGVYLFDPSSASLGSGFTPATPSARMAAAASMSGLLDGYVLSGSRGAAVAGRSATLVEASRPALGVTRWWIDVATGVVLWRQDLGPDGALERSSGFTELTMLTGAGGMGHLPPRTAAASTNTALTLSHAIPLRASGWMCPPALAGLPLLGLRSDEPATPGALHLVYSDGVRAVSVFEQRGRLTAVPPRAAWQARSGAYERHGATEQAVWQSGEIVFTVMTDGSEEVLGAAVAALPHDDPRRRTTMERVHAGWAKILADMKG